MFDPDNSNQFQYKLDLSYQAIHNALELTPYWFAHRVLQKLVRFLLLNDRFVFKCKNSKMQ